MNPRSAQDTVLLEAVAIGVITILGSLGNGKGLPKAPTYAAVGLLAAGLMFLARVNAKVAVTLGGIAVVGAALTSYASGKSLAEAAFDQISKFGKAGLPASGETATDRFNKLADSGGIAASVGNSVAGNVGVSAGTGGGKAAAAGIASAQVARPAIWEYKQVRPIPKDITASHIITDCSGFVTMCYHAAGLPDPNGRNYDGQGYTGTLWAHGTKTETPQVGDLVFYGVPWLAGGAAHVAIIVSKTECVGFGSNPGPRRNPINYRPVVGYRTYPGR